MKARNAQFVIDCLALAALMILVAPAPASASGVAFSTSSLPVQVRGEGLTEVVGAVVLQATGNGTVLSGSSITVSYAGVITNASSFTAQTGLACSFNSQVCNTVPSSMVLTASGTQATLQFNANQAFLTNDYIEISEFRMNINSLGTAATTALATISGNSSNPTSNPITFTQSQVLVASIVNPSISGRISLVANTIQTCNIPSGGGATPNQFALRVSENYPAALTSLGDEQAFSSVGGVSNGSLINVTFTNIPSGFGVEFVSAIAQGSSTMALIPGIPTGTSNTPASGYSAAISGGSAITYTFSVSGDSPSIIDSSVLTFDIGYANGNNSLAGSSAPSLGTIVIPTATVSLGPSAGVVSFAANNEGSGSIATIGDCVTNLLFPFAANQVGFDTTIQISNMSADRLAFPSGGASAQSGTCTLTFYPTDLTTQTATHVGNQGTPSQFTTPNIPAGGVYSFAQSVTSFRGQSGYMFAVCRFLDAHGFSYLVNGSAITGTISQGLLALVIPNSSIATGRLANPSATCIPSCTGTSCSASCTVVQGVTFPPGGNWEGIAH